MKFFFVFLSIIFFSSKIFAYEIFCYDSPTVLETNQIVMYKINRNTVKVIKIITGSKVDIMDDIEPYKIIANTKKPSKKCP